MNTTKNHGLINLLLLGGLLFLRFPFLIVLTMTAAETSSVQRLVTLLGFEIGTYLLTALLIWRERERLSEFWFDLPAAVTFLCQIFLFPVGIFLFWKMKKSQSWFPKPQFRVWRWALIGAILGIACEILLTTQGFVPPGPRGDSTADFSFLFPAVLIQMTNAAVWEEPLFRGFLWGYLRQIKWPNFWIWLFQAVLFTLGHVYYLQNENVWVWLVRMLLPSLLLGLIAWQAKSIFASMLTHGCINACGDMLLHTRSLPEAVSVGINAMLVLGAVLLVVGLLEIILLNFQSGKNLPA
jgi:membrane protease YdiL (CAAX protease family)